MSEWMQVIARHLDRVHLSDTIGAGLALILIVYVVGHVIAWIAR